MGTGLLYTSPEFRDKLDDVMVGAELMLQGTDYLDHTWNPHRTAKRFEFSTSPVSLAAALQTGINDVHLRYGMENIRDEVFRLQDIVLGGIDRERFNPVLFPEAHRSGILALACREDPALIMRALERERVLCTSRGGYLRIAPHFYNSDEEMQTAVSLLNSVKV